MREKFPWKYLIVSSISVYSAAGDLGLHHGLDGLLALACDANGELIERGHHGVMPTEKPVNDLQYWRFKISRLMHPSIPLMSGMHNKSQ